jgi:hypothetical protein
MWRTKFVNHPAEAACRGALGRGVIESGQFVSIHSLDMVKLFGENTRFRESN